MQGKDYKWMCERAIVSPRNTSVDEINYEILKKVPGEEVFYKSLDTVVNIEDAVHYPIEFLNSIISSGTPIPHFKIKS